VLCRDTSDGSVDSADGIRRIVAMDDSLLWMVSGGDSSIKRWRSPQRRVVRAKALIQDMDSSLCEPPVQSRQKPSDPSHTPTLVRPDAFSSLSDAPFATLLAASQTQDHRDGDREDRDREGSAAATTTLYGIPYDSLVKLTSPNDPLTPYFAVSQVRDRAPPVAPLYSAASVTPVPHTATSRSSLHSAVQQIPRRTNMGTSSRPGVTTGCDAIVLSTSWGSGEEQAQPVIYPSPDEIIEGDHGLVRSIVLNDRMHALTLDTLGRVAVWELVRGICLGRYSPEDVAQANHGGGANGGGEGDKRDREANAMDVLEAVRERIEGEAVVVPWSSVDTKTGVLAVHIMERCFEAEIYPDECGFKPDKPNLRRK
jgi:WD repeat-containing protein 48